MPPRAADATDNASVAAPPLVRVIRRLIRRITRAQHFPVPRSSDNAHTTH
jgi:hypothetical protein